LITGAVLAGGKSSRYGRNKSLEIFQGVRLIDRIVESLRPECQPVFIIANDLSHYHESHATLVRDVIAHQGPLGGLYTALLFSPNPWVFAKATDMPFLAPGLLEMLVVSTDGCDAVVPFRGGRPEPLLALYHRRCFPVIADLLESGERKVSAIYSKAKIRPLDEERWRAVDPDGRSFLNVNSREELERLEWI
jgi:molybdenum cofactor guanylyltransferase